MYWLTSTSAILVIALIVRQIHTSNCNKRIFFPLLASSLAAFNFAIASILAVYWIDAFPRSQSRMLLGQVGIAVGIAILMRCFWPAKYNHLAEHKKILTHYSLILLVAGFVGGIIFAIPVMIRDDYIIKSDQWADIGTAIAVVEITSLYSLALTLILAIGSNLFVNQKS